MQVQQLAGHEQYHPSEAAGSTGLQPFQHPCQREALFTLQNQVGQFPQAEPKVTKMFGHVQYLKDSGVLRGRGAIAASSLLVRDSLCEKGCLEHSVGMLEQSCVQLNEQARSRSPGVMMGIHSDRSQPALLQQGFRREQVSRSDEQVNVAHRTQVGLWIQRAQHHAFEGHARYRSFGQGGGQRQRLLETPRLLNAGLQRKQAPAAQLGLWNGPLWQFGEDRIEDGEHAVLQRQVQQMVPRLRGQSRQAAGWATADGVSQQRAQNGLKLRTHTYESARTERQPQVWHRSSGFRLGPEQ